MLEIRPLAAKCAERRPDQGCATCGAKDISVCHAITGPDLAQLDALAEHVTFAPGDPLIREADPAQHVFNITSGSVRVFKLLADGRRQIIGFLFAGDFIGLASGDSYVFWAEAIEPVTACRFRRDAYRQLIRDSPSLEATLLDRANHELAAAQSQMLLLGRKTAQERIASFLLDLPAHDPARPRAPGHVHLPMNRSEIADYLGLTIETVSRVLTRLKGQSLISTPSLTEVLILQPRKLRAIADGAT